MLLFGLMTGTHARADPSSGLVHDGVLDVCTNPTLPPMTFVPGADASDLAGVDIDVARAVAQAWGARMVLHSMDFVGLFPSLESGRCAIVISGVTRQPARERLFDAVSYLPTALVVVARAGTRPIGSLADLSGQMVVTQSGTSYAARLERENAALAAQGRAPIRIQQYPAEEQVVQQVLLGRAFAFVSQDVELGFRARQLHGKVAVILQPQDDNYRSFALYIRKNPTDRAALQAAIDHLDQTGALRAIADKWHIRAATALTQDLSTPPRFDVRAFALALLSVGFARAALVTLAIALLSHATAIALSMPMALALNRPGGVVRRAVGLYVALFRAVPTLLQLLFVWNALPQFFPVFRGDWFSPFLAAWIALSLNEAAYQVEINRAALGAIDPGQLVAGEALGLTRFEVYRHVLFPQALRVALPPTINEFINLLKTTSLASVISLQELMALTQIHVARTFEFTEYYAVALVYYVAMVCVLLLTQKRVERRFHWADRVKAGAHGG
ncbi:ABC transporter substrate-binding protein/permease [Ameyamaea chiangmaiensis]|nr:ABC transporter substrate-binding protein/permease [Ameyamaea chiangmaiensis]